MHTVSLQSVSGAVAPDRRVGCGAEDVPHRRDQGGHPQATVPEHATAIADEHEVLVLLTDAARRGSGPAMKALLAYDHGHAKQPDGARDVFDELDQLAGASALRCATGSDELGAITSVA